MIELYGKTLPPSVDENFPTELIEANLHHINYYIVQSTVSLREFLVNIEGSADTSIHQVAESLFNYLVLEDDLIPDTENGIYGFIDDAWLIHNMIYRCIEADIQESKSYSIDWPILVATDGLIVNIIPDVILGKLNEIVLKNLTSLESHLDSYVPILIRDHRGMKLAAIIDKGEALKI